ncbi:MAG: Abi family protein [Rikenellaceae bacterium]
MRTKYLKSFKTPLELVDILQDRGLTIFDTAKAAAYIQNIGYFRLSAYFFPLLNEIKTDHSYKPNSTFKQAMDMYRFDRKLRLLCFNEIEKIEVALRSVIVNTSSEFFNDPFWMTASQNFRIIRSIDKRTNKSIEIKWFDKFIDNINRDIERSNDDFIIHFKKCYSDPYPPSWMIAEILTFGNLSRIFKGLNQKSLQKKISQKFGLSSDVLESWMLSLAGVRNICCHHSRLWNRSLPLSVMSPKRPKYGWIDNDVDNSRTFYRLSMIKYLLCSVSPNNSFKEKLIQLLADYPTIDTNAIGFPKDWQSQPLWRD